MAVYVYTSQWRTHLDLAGSSCRLFRSMPIISSNDTLAPSSAPAAFKRPAQRTQDPHAAAALQ